MRRSLLPWLVTVLVLGFLYLPIAVLIAGSFNASRFGGSWEGFSLRWYRGLLHHRDLVHALRNTLVVAAGSTLLSTVLGTTAALALHFGGSRLQRLHYLLVCLPLVVPEVLTGISLLLLFVALGVPLGLGTVFLAHVTFCLSFVAMVVLSRLQDFDPALLEAAQDLGATRWQTGTRVLLPLLAPGIAAGALLAVTLSVDDFVITFFVAGPGSTTLPIYIQSMIRHSSPPLINALSTVLLAGTFAAACLSRRLLGDTAVEGSPGGEPGLE